MCAKARNNEQQQDWRDTSLPLSDGIKLLARIWFPKGEGPWPALLMRQPYGRAIASTVTYAHPAWWAQKGFLVVIQDVRGQGDSGGQFAGFAQEAADTSATHAWVRELPECNGRLGTYGFSYQGLTQLLAQPGTPPPDCMAPAMTGIDERQHWSCDGGAHWWHLGLAWGLQLAALQARRQGNREGWDQLRCSLESGRYLREGAALLERHDPAGMAWKWLQQPADNKDAWIVHQPLASWLRQPMLLLGGWWDPHLKGLLDLYQRSCAAGGHPELHIGPATHLQWWPEAQQLQLNFFQQHLQSQPKGQPAEQSSQQPTKNPEPHLQIWNLTTKTWQRSQGLAAQPNAPSAHWGLMSEGLACLDPNDGQLCLNNQGRGIVHLVHDPWRAVPAIGGHLSPSPGPAERSAIDQRADVATFTTPSLNECLHLEGIPWLEITVQADQPGFDLCVALSATNQDQSQIEQLSTGVLRLQGDSAMQPLSRKVVLQPLFADLQPGQHLRISLAGAAWPAIGINPGIEQHRCGAPEPHFQAVTLIFELEGSKLQLMPLNSGNMGNDLSQDH